jgi:hypothetical protein
MDRGPGMTNRLREAANDLLFDRLIQSSAINTFLGPLSPTWLKNQLQEWRNRHLDTLTDAELDAEDKKQAASRIDSLTNKVKFEIALNGLLIRLFYAIFSFSLMAVPIAVARAYDIPAVQLLVPWGAVYMGTLLVALMVLVLPFALLGERGESEPRFFGPNYEEVPRRTSATVEGWWYLSAVFLYAIAIARILEYAPLGTPYLGSPALLGVLSGLIVTGIFATIPLLLSMLALAWWLLKLHRWRRTSTEAMVLSDLVLALYGIQGDWRMQRRIFTLRMLEHAARDFEGGFAKAIGQLDNKTNFWLLSKVRKRAAGIRAIKRDVCLPKQNAQEDVTRTLEHLISTSVRGSWAELPVLEEPETNQERSLRKTLTRSFRQLVIAFLPLGILWYTRLTEISLEPTIGPLSMDVRDRMGNDRDALCPGLNAAR